MCSVTFGHITPHQTRYPDRAGCQAPAPSSVSAQGRRQLWHQSVSTAHQLLSEADSLRVDSRRGRRVSPAEPLSSQIYPLGYRPALQQQVRGMICAEMVRGRLVRGCFRLLAPLRACVAGVSSGRRGTRTALRRLLPLAPA